MRRKRLLICPLTALLCASFCPEGIPQPYEAQEQFGDGPDGQQFALSYSGAGEAPHGALGPEAHYTFAEELFRGREYEAAIVQYRLLLHLYPDFESAPRCAMKMALCSFCLGRYDRALYALEELLQDDRFEPLWDQLLLFKGLCFYSSGDLAAAVDLFSTLSRDASAGDVRAYSCYLLAWAYLAQGRFGVASRLFRRLEVGLGQGPALLDIDMAGLSAACKKGESLERKSPLIAGIAAGVLPGAGHFYCERYQDGLVAFSLNAAFTAASIECLQKQVWVAGGIASSVELIWYSGTIYGAVNAAHRFNRSKREEFLDALRRDFGDERTVLIERLYN